MNELTDQSIMKWGQKYKGNTLANVPANYLLWLWDNSEFPGEFGQQLRAYIEDNLDALLKEDLNP